MLKIIIAVAFALVAALAFAACGGDDEPNGTTDTTDTPGATATAEPDGDPTPSPEPTEEPTASPAQVDADACELMSNEFVEGVIGSAVEFKDRGLGEGVPGRLDTCYYHFGGSSEVVVRAARDARNYYDSSLGDPVEGIADEAKWSAGLRTLIVLRGENIAEVGISPTVALTGSETDPLEAAKLMAEELLAGL